MIEILRTHLGYIYDSIRFNWYRLAKKIFRKVKDNRIAG